MRRFESGRRLFFVLENRGQLEAARAVCGAVAEREDAGDLKSPVREDVWVRIPPALLFVTRQRGD